MFSQLYFKILAQMIKISGFLRGSPFQWDDKNCRLIVSPKQLKKCRKRVALVVLFMSYIGILTIQVKINGSLSEFNLQMVFFYMGIIICMLQLILVWDPYDFAYLANAGIINFFKKFHSKSAFK